MEDNLKKKWKTTSTNKKMEDDLKEKKKGRRPQKKIKNEEDIKKNQFCSQFHFNLGQTFPGIGSAL
jgi:hypothetical protein